MNNETLLNLLNTISDAVETARDAIEEAGEAVAEAQDEAQGEEHTFTRTLYANIYHGKRDVIRTLFPTAEKAREATTSADIVAMPVEVTVTYRLPR